MGFWNSDGTFGYAGVPLSAGGGAAEDLINPGCDSDTIPP
jgi:hypothetical protein